ncbi:Protein disulfide-isomerase TMX3 [Hypsibius exemplaris]|uniref:Protein disulfide-isomerase TMX3 n=1 Tax=Hypsibius exemplaris TaxID=2072580 RepID=A0A1W0X251_HYPEX|nr:Protein disulfide-isomerase TMX3 [Hypsibius exemplaris]
MFCLNQLNTGLNLDRAAFGPPKMFGSWILAVFSLIIAGDAFKVSYELDDRFIEYRKDAKWLVMFYAPWCHHCHKSEPIWEQVAQTFNQHNSGLGVRVGKIDATKQTRSAAEFHVKGFPTIKFIQGDNVVTYDGERTREDIEEFAYKASGPAVRKLTELSELRAAEGKNEVFFVIVTGENSSGELRQEYGNIAQTLMTTTYFYETDSKLASGNVPLKGWTTVAVFKDNKYFTFDETTSKSLKDWIEEEKMPSFPKISGGNFYQLIALKKPIVIAVVEQMPFRHTMDAAVEKIYDHVEEIATGQREKYHDKLSFGFVDGNEIVNHVFSEWIEVPAVVVYDPVQETYYISAETPQTITTESLQKFLDGILAGEVHGAGGKGWFRKAYKFFYSIAAYFYKMFSTQPILSSILLGLPLGILTIILVMMYTNDCTDNKEEDEGDDDSDHEKEE